MIVEIAFAIAIIMVIYYVTKKKQPTPNLPPGPKPYPLVANLPHLGGPMRHLAMTNLAKEYGKIYSLLLPGGQQCVVINTAELAREALMTRRDEFSGRPYTFIGNYLTRNTADIICADFTQNMIRLRKIAHSALKMYGSGMQRIESKICFEVDYLAKRFMEHNGTPVDPKDDVSVAVLNVICSLVYGQRYEIDDPEFKDIVEYNDKFIQIFGSYNLLDLFPWLRFIPFETVRIMNHAKGIRDRIITRKYHEHKEKFEVENANNNFEIQDLTDALLQAFEDAKFEDVKGVKVPLTEDNIMMTMQDVFNAGFETTTTTIRWALAYLVCYPEIQAKAHAELDDVIGSGRLPQLKDRNSLPYLEAVLAEVMRISTLLPLSLPHKATCDTTLAGYDIPAETMVITNLWAIHHNPDDWENPEEFVPSRFLDSDGKFVAAGVRSFLPFSAGRRHCLGESLAKTELFLIFSRIVHQFEFRKPPGIPLPTLKGCVGVVYHPESFKIIINERESR